MRMNGGRGVHRRHCRLKRRKEGIIGLVSQLNDIGLTTSCGTGFPDGLPLTKDGTHGMLSIGTLNYVASLNIKTKDCIVLKLLEEGQICRCDGRGSKDGISCPINTLYAERCLDVE